MKSWPVATIGIPSRDNNMTLRMVRAENMEEAYPWSRRLATICFLRALSRAVLPCLAEHLENIAEPNSKSLDFFDLLNYCSLWFTAVSEMA
jgi:hypothetical protein